MFSPKADKTETLGMLVHFMRFHSLLQLRGSAHVYREGCGGARSLRNFGYDRLSVLDVVCVSPFSWGTSILDAYLGIHSILA